MTALTTSNGTRTIPEPFFEIGPKTYLDRARLLDVAKAAAEAAVEFGVSTIVTAPMLDIECVKSANPDLWVFAQHMDPARPGATTGALVAEALRDVGADGTMLNHHERRLSRELLQVSIARAHEVGLASLVCVESLEEAAEVAAMGPRILLAEPPELIGADHSGPRPWMPRIDAAVARVDPRVQVMHAGGIGAPDHAAAVIRQGAAGTGATSAIVRSDQPEQVVRDMIAAVRAGWDSRHSELPWHNRFHTT